VRALSQRAIALLTLVVACNSSDAPRVAAAGSYDLVTINGQALPAPSGTNLIARGGVYLDACAHFVLFEVDTVAGPGSPSFPPPIGGAWSTKGDSIHLTTPSQGTYSGTLIASELILVPAASPGEVWVYHRH
jgi:hypothetical protein